MGARIYVRALYGVRQCCVQARIYGALLHSGMTHSAVARLEPGCLPVEDGCVAGVIKRGRASGVRSCLAKPVRAMADQLRCRRGLRASVRLAG